MDGTPPVTSRRGEAAAPAAPAGSVARVADVMSRPVVTIPLEADLDTARRLMPSRRIHHLLVEDRGRIVGIVSDRDVTRGLSPALNTLAETERDSATLRHRVFRFATFHPFVVGESASIEEAAALLLERGVSALPVVGAQGRVSGIIPTRDLLRGLLSCALPRAA